MKSGEGKSILERRMESKSIDRKESFVGLWEDTQVSDTEVFWVLQEFEWALISILIVRDRNQLGPA